jgi:hypothetical protein
VWHCIYAVCACASRCWLYLSKEIGAVLDAVPEDYQIHIIWAVAKRAKEQDMVLCRLALFLDPRFRQAALAGSNDLADFTKKASHWGHAQVCGVYNGCEGTWNELCGPMLTGAC